MQKFIVTHEGIFRFGNVRMHRDLLKNGDMCIGGGFYEFDFISNRLLLSGKSYDFGKPKWNYIDTLKVPEAFKGLKIFYEDEEISNYINIEYI